MAVFQKAAGPHRPEIDSLTSLRFVAALWVVALHYTDIMPFDFATVTGLFAHGKLGVDFFFILSGFILTHVYWRSLNEGRFRFGRFLQRRLARIYPLHIVTFLAVLGYVMAGRLMGLEVGTPEAYSLDAVWPNLLLIHAWGIEDHMSWNYVSWSISAEWFAYLLFLPLSLLILKAPVPALGRLGLAVALLAAFYALSEPVVGRPLTHLTHDFAILRILPEFVLGITLYHVSTEWALAPRAGLALLALAAGVIGLLVHVGADDLPTILLLGFVIFACASLERHGGIAALRHRWLVYLGEVSYSLYMVHAIVFTVYFKAASLVLGEAYERWVYWVGPVALVGCLVAAVMAYHLVEKPARSLLCQPWGRSPGQPLGRFLAPRALLGRLLVRPRGAAGEMDRRAEPKPIGPGRG